MAESTAERYARVNARADELAAVPAILSSGGTITPVHQAAATVFTELIRFGAGAASSGKAPVHLRALMRTLEKSQPMLLDGLAKMPAEQIQAFMAQLIAQLQIIVDAPAVDGAA